MLKPQMLEVFFVLACSLVGFAAGAPEQSHVRHALQASVRMLTPGAPASRDMVIQPMRMRSFCLRPLPLLGSSR
jgi:hypothetical protein